MAETAFLRFVIGKDELAMERKAILDAEQIPAQDGGVALNVRLVPAQGEELGRFTADHIGSMMDIFVCDKLVLQPMIMDAIYGGTFMITGHGMDVQALTGVFAAGDCAAGKG
ncbi:MAG: SecDF P1 head subdomain-containing protein [Paracoccaceae bacterium]